MVGESAVSFLTQLYGCLMHEALYFLAAIFIALVVLVQLLTADCVVAFVAY